MSAQALFEVLREEHGVLCELARPPVGGNSSGPQGPAQLAASGPRATGRKDDYELMIELILEGSRLHYGRPAVVRTDDPDLALLLGDQLYALGLERLGALDDLIAVQELADVISLIAQAHLASDPELPDAVWMAGAAAVGWGPCDAHRAAKELLRAERPGAKEALRASVKASIAGASS